MSFGRCGTYCSDGSLQAIETLLGQCLPYEPTKEVDRGTDGDALARQRGCTTLGDCLSGISEFVYGDVVCSAICSVCYCDQPMYVSFEDDHCFDRLVLELLFAGIARRRP